MDKDTLLESFGQVNITEAASLFGEFVRVAVAELACNVMAAEATKLCGACYHPDKSSDAFRAGSAPGTILFEGERLPVKRPRVRKRKDDGASEEMQLLSYAAATDPGKVKEMFMRALRGGVSTRDQKHVFPHSPAASKSNISRMWAVEGDRLFEEFRSRDIRRDDWLVLILDGVVLHKDETVAIVALGVAEDGTKHMLDFEVGSTENSVVGTALCARLTERGFAPKVGCRLLCLFDGSKALRKSAKTQWSDAVFQRCLVHKERNLRAYLARTDWAELARLMKRLRDVQGEKAGRKALQELHDFVAARNAKALKSLEEAGDDLITVHLLNVPNTLHKSLLSTNIVENSIRNIRRKTRRVMRWRPETNQAWRWLAMALLEAERGFHRIAGYRDLWYLAAALGREKDQGEAKAVVAPPPHPRDLPHSAKEPDGKTEPPLTDGPGSLAPSRRSGRVPALPYPPDGHTSQYDSEKGEASSNQEALQETLTEASATATIG